AGGRAETQTRGVIASDRESAEPDRERSGTPQAEAVDGDRDRFEGGQGLGEIQSEQTLHPDDRAGPVELVAAGGNDRAGSEVRWDLCDSHQRDSGAVIGRRYGARLQESGAGRARLPQFKGLGSADSPDSPSHRGASAGAYFPVPVGLLPGVAAAARVGASAVWRRGTSPTTATTRSGSAGQQLGIGSSQETHAPDG